MPKEKETQNQEQELARLQAENEALRRDRLSDEIPAEIRDDVRQRMAAGLSKEQAISVAKAQLAWDAEQAKQAKSAK